MTAVRDWGVFRIHVGDCRESTRAMAAGSAHTCITSPPYFGLRDYGHDGQIGLETTPDAFVAQLVEVFREVRRVLRDDGTLWLNLGDSYANDGKWGGHSGGKHDYGDGGLVHQPIGRNKKYAGLKPKDLIGIPWRVAFALQQDGWYLRQDIIWHKPNPMPESVRDRCTKAHEYLFLLTKSERYYWDHDAMQELATGKPPGNKRPTKAARTGATEHRTAAALHEIGARETRNRRSVWTVPTHPFSGAHFATFPPALIEPCVLAGAPVGGVVLDPFGGAGTTAMVAARHGRIGVACELNPEYVDLAERRIATDIFGPAAVAA
jgi:DNA modification methylase